jgi:hypothetical protein
MLISNIAFVKDSATLDPLRRAEIKYEKFTLRFSTDDSLQGNAWQTFLNKYPPAPGLNKRELIKYLKKSAHTILLNQGRVKNIRAFRKWYKKMETFLPAVARQGIVCAGKSATDIRILNNSIYGLAQGIHVGLSHYDPKEYVNYKAGRVQISGNHIVIYLSGENYGGRHGIFVGNCESLDIECNYMKVERFPSGIARPIDGVRIYGQLGKMVQIRKNHTNGFNTGIFARGTKRDGTHLWQIYSNMLEDATNKVNASPADSFLKKDNH